MFIDSDPHRGTLLDSDPTRGTLLDSDPNRGTLFDSDPTRGPSSTVVQPGTELAQLKVILLDKDQNKGDSSSQESAKTRFNKR